MNKKPKIVNAFRQIYDMDQYKNSWKYPTAKFPYIICFGATNACNLDCLMCLRHEMKRKLTFLDLDLYKKMIDEAKKEGVKGVRFIGYGENLLHKQIFEMLGYARSKGILVHLTTNGLLLNKEKISRLLDIGIDSMVFSMQGTTKEEYQLMRNNNKYEALVEIIKMLIKMRDERGLTKPHVSVTTTILDETPEQVEAFKKKWLAIVDFTDVWYTSLLRFKNKERIKDLLGRQRIAEHIATGPCNEVLTKLSIYSNGILTACCGDIDGELKVGSFKENTIKEIWGSDKMRYLQETLRKGQRDKIPFCRLCTNKF